MVLRNDVVTEPDKKFELLCMSEGKSLKFHELQVKEHLLTKLAKNICPDHDVDLLIGVKSVGNTHG